MAFSVIVPLLAAVFDKAAVVVGTAVATAALFPFNKSATTSCSSIRFFRSSNRFASSASASAAFAAAVAAADAAAVITMLMFALLSRNGLHTDIEATAAAAAAAFDDEGGVDLNGFVAALPLVGVCGSCGDMFRNGLLL